jgi:hypothetical protein
VSTGAAVKKYFHVFEVTLDTLQLNAGTFKSLIVAQFIDDVPRVCHEEYRGLRIIKIEVINRYPQEVKIDRQILQVPP